MNAGSKKIKSTKKIRSSCILILYRNDIPVDLYEQVIMYPAEGNDPASTDLEITSKKEEFRLVCNVDEIVSMLPDYIIKQEFMKRSETK